MSKCCSSSNNCCPASQPKKVIAIEFLYLDLSVCGRCQETGKSLDEAVSDVMAVLTAAGFEVTVNKVNIATRELARQYRFFSSPTIRVNGNDIADELKESLCEDCGTLCGEDVDCRVWTYNGIEYTTPPKGLIVNAILKEVYGGVSRKTDGKEYVFPENLENYFAAKELQDKKQNK